MVEFISENSHSIFCWSWALGVCVSLFTVMILIDFNWKGGYERGYEDAKEKYNLK